MSKYNNQRKSLVLTADVVIPEERKLVLKRIKPPPPHLRERFGDILLLLAIAAVTGSVGIKKALLFSAGLFRKPELVRQVGPGLQPEPEYAHRRPPVRFL